MFKEKDLWNSRLKIAVKDMSRYLQYIFNGHLVVVMLFLLGTLLYYYQAWVQTLSGNFPVAIVMSLSLVLFITYSPTYTFLLQADKIFLLPVESKLRNYFLRANFVSLFLQTYVFLLILAALMPMYVQVNGGGYQAFFKLLLAVLILKALNIFIRKYILYYVDRLTHKVDFIIRLLLNSVGLYFLFKGETLLFGTVLILLLALLVYFSQSVHDKGLKWDLLIELEEKRVNSFYRLANLFTDVPQLRESVKQRSYLNFIIKRIPYGEKYSYLNLYVRTFFRSGDYLGLLVRLTFIAALAIIFIPNLIAQVIISCLFIYLTGFQLLPLQFHHDNNLFLSLSPVSLAEKLRSFRKILLVALLFQTIVFVMVNLVLGLYVNAVIVGALNLVFSFGFVMFNKSLTGSRDSA